jgi:hypothetical protein
MRMEQPFRRNYGQQVFIARIQKDSSCEVAD